MRVSREGCGTLGRAGAGDGAGLGARVGDVAIPRASGGELFTHKSLRAVVGRQISDKPSPTDHF